MTQATQTKSGKVIRPAPVSIDGSASRRSTMISAPYFAVDLFELKTPHDFSTRDESGKDSAQILVAVDGFGVVEVQGRDPVTLGKGDAIVVPAALGEFSVRPQWSLEFLKAWVPGVPAPEPATRL